MKTMPFLSTCAPSGTCVASTSSPARNGGSKMPSSSSLQLMLPAPSFDGLEQQRDRAVEQTEEIARLVVAADRERQHHRRDSGMLGQPLRGAGVLVGRTDHELGGF